MLPVQVPDCAVPAVRVSTAWRVLTADSESSSTAAMETPAGASVKVAEI